LFEVFAPAEIDPRRNLTPAIYLAFFVSFAFVRRNGFPVKCELMRTVGDAMKEVRGKARKCIQRLVESTDTVTKILEDLDIGRTTYYGARGWIRDPVFLDKLAEERRIFEFGLRGKYVSKRRRIEELEANYDSIPKTAKELWQNGMTRRVHRNDGERRAHLDQIRKELEGDSVLGTGPATPKDESDLIKRRRESAARIEAYRKKERDDALDAEP
jgi:hypothetical protein